MHLAAATAVCMVLLSFASHGALSQQPTARAVESLHSHLTYDSEPLQIRGESPRNTASFDYTLGTRQDRVVRQLTQQMDLHDELRKSIELEKANESPLTTLLNLSRFLTSKGYKRADGSPLIDLTF
jgi:hypothetical protein